MSTYVINSECIMCGACEPNCPESAISEGADTYIIDQAKCSGCGTCVENCPVEAPQQAN
jgi:ferredoxin